VVLLAATAVALVWANSPLGNSYTALWATTLPHVAGLPYDARHWVDDALMAVFFFAIGLEVKREISVGELSHPRAVAMAALAALGGAAVPSAVFLAITWGSSAAHGWGIPMATDPAFAVGVLAVLARRAPSGVRLLLLAIATVDDVLAVVVIAAGYSRGLAWLTGRRVGGLPAGRHGALVRGHRDLAVPAAGCRRLVCHPALGYQPDEVSAPSATTSRVLPPPRLP
jgi:NhaA family Na+:H+ antiporter